MHLLLLFLNKSKYCAKGFLCCENLSTPSFSYARYETGKNISREYSHFKINHKISIE